MKRLLLIAYLGFLYLPALGASESGTHPDESYYLGISADMDLRGEWLTPTLDGRPTWFKPPLLYWAERLAYAALGRNLFAARLPGALAAIALAVLTGALARRMYGDGAELAAALLTGTAFGFLKFGRMAMMDAPMALALAVAAYGTWRASEEGRERLLLLAGAGAGAATLLKGPVGAVLVLLVSGGFLALRRPRLLAGRWTGAAFALGAAVALPWYVASLAVHGRAFYDFFVVSQNIDRFRHPWTWSGEVTLIAGFLVFLAPWTLLFLSALPSPHRLRQPELLLPAAWIAAVLLTFTVPALKWPHYGLACLPAAALLASRAPPPRWARLGTAALLGLGAAAVLLALRWPLPGAAWAALSAAAALLAVAAGMAARDRIAAGATATGAALALILAVVIPRVNPPAIPADALSAAAGRELHVYNHVPGLFTLAAGRTVHRPDTDAQVGQALASGGALVIEAPELDHVPGDLRPRLQTLARWRRIPGYLPAGAVWRSWLARDPGLLLEEMRLVALRPD